MKKIILIALCFSFSLIAFGQPRGLRTTRTNASLMPSVTTMHKEPNYDPVVLNLGKVVEVDDGVAYVKIGTKINKYGEGDFYFYACNLRGQATAMLNFRVESYGGISAMDIIEGACHAGDNVYMRFVPKVPNNN